MTKSELDAAAAVRRFADALAATPDRVLVKLNGADGMTALAAVEAALRAVWPASTAKELVWLTRNGAGETLQLQAFAADGAALGDRMFQLPARAA